MFITHVRCFIILKQYKFCDANYMNYDDYVINDRLLSLEWYLQWYDSYQIFELV